MKANRGSSTISVIVILVLILIVVWVLFYINWGIKMGKQPFQDNAISQDNSDTQVTNSIVQDWDAPVSPEAPPRPPTTDVEEVIRIWEINRIPSIWPNIPRISFQEALSQDWDLMSLFNQVELNLDNEINLFDDFYTAFDNLKTFEDYKEFSKKYPSLLPVIYAAKLEDRENYTKFYDFIFDKLLEDNIPEYIDDLREINGGQWEWEDLRKPFVDFMNEQFSVIVQWKTKFNFELWDGPIHIALSADDGDTAQKNCDNSKISWVDKSTRRECYSYVIHYRATDWGELCELLPNRYDMWICYSFLNSKKF